MFYINGLTKRFGKNTVFNHISLQLDNRNYGLLGPNGSGKTTLFRIIAGLLSAEEGSLQSDTGETLQIGYLPQKFGGFPNLTVKEQLQYFAYLKAKKGDGILWDAEIERAISLTHLEEQRDMKCSKLSGGMIRRLGIAQAIMGKPDLILLDEPTVGLDIEERLRLRNVLEEIQGHQPLIMSTHILEDVQMVCSDIIVLHNKEIRFQGTADDLKAAADHRVYLLEESIGQTYPDGLKFITKVDRVFLQYVPQAVFLYLFLVPAHIQACTGDESETARIIFGMNQLILPIAVLWPQFIYFLPIKAGENREMMRGLRHPDKRCALVLWLFSQILIIPIIVLDCVLVPNNCQMFWVIFLQTICTTIGFQFLSELASSAVAGTVVMIIYLALSVQLCHYTRLSLIQLHALLSEIPLKYYVARVIIAVAEILVSNIRRRTTSSV